MTIHSLELLERERRLDDVLTTYLKALESGQDPDRQALLDGNPELAEELREYFLGQDRLDLFAAPLRSVAQAAQTSVLNTWAQDQTLYEASGSLAPGLVDAIGDYEILEEIAQGGMGVVYKARHRQLQRLVALKVLLAGPFAQPADLQRFRSETEIVASLDHPNIVPIYDVGANDKQPYFSMKLIEGGSLATHAERFRADPRAAAGLLVSLARAVHHAHERGILHRDLKPSNVLLDRSGQPHLTDFGLARWVAEDRGLSQSGAIVGTPSFMAPEQTTGRRQLITTASDVYGLGAILYYLLTSKPPFRGDTPLDTLQQLQDRDPDKPRVHNPLVPPDLEIICLQCLAKDPGKRYASAQELGDDLSRFLAGEPIRARAVGRWERLRKWVRRQPALAALVALSGLSVVGLVAGLLLHNARQQEALLETTKERERADANYRAARDTLRKILDHARARNSEGVPKLRELQRRQQVEALAFFLKMAEQQGGSSEVRFEVAQAYHQAGLLQATLGQPEDATRSFRRAEEEFAALVADLPERALYREHHALALKDLGSAGGLPPAAAEPCLRRALALAEGVVREEPRSIPFRVADADVRSTLANFLYNQRRLSEAEDHYRGAASLYEDLVREQPEAPSHRRALAKVYACHSLLVQQGKRSPHALHDKAEVLLEQLHREKPDDDDVLEGLGMLRVNWAYMLQAERKPDLARAGLTKNVRMLEEALRREPNHALLRDVLLRSYGLRSEGLEGQKRFAEAVEDRKRTVELSASPAEADFARLFLALAYARAGRHALAVNTIDDWNTRATPNTPAEQLHHCALVYCAALVALPAESVLSPERKETVARYTTRALDFLRRAKKAYGTKRWQDLVPGLRLAEDLRPLWNHEEFERLLSEPRRGGSQ